jgi:hypothetical protein
MKEYIISWVIAMVVPTSCPDSGRLDEFGRVEKSIIICTAYHTDTWYLDRERHFVTKDSALAFLDKLRKESNNTSTYSLLSEDKIINVKFDSIIKITN